MKKTKLFILLILFSISAFTQEWEIQHEVSLGSRLRSVSFVSENVGYAVGENGKILKTTDGETWEDISLSTPTYIFSVHFIDANTGYIAGSGGMLKKTIDGGLNWVDQQIVTDESLMCVSFFDSNLGFAVGRGGTIMKTTNGGENWEDLTQLSFSKNINYVHIVDSNIVYLAVEWGSGTDSLRKTTNGGQDWVSLVTETWGPLVAVHFSDLNNGLVVGELGKISRTTNGGENWLASRQSSWDLHSVNFIDMNHGYLVGHLGTILKTTDGGESWGQEVSGTNSILYSVKMIENAVYAVGSQSVILKKVINDGNLSIDDNSKSNEVLIYPTITSGKIEITASLTESLVLIEIIDLQGKKVQSINLNLTTSKTVTLNPTLQNGLYFIRISMNNSMISKKIILKK